jgi:3-hydroxybutyryl-CoA dehydratase
MNTFVWEDLRVGLAAEFTAVVTQGMMDSFLANYGDNNPMHVDADRAKQFGYAGPLAYGLLTSSFYSTLVGVYLPGKHALLHGIDISFVEPAYVGDTLIVRGAIDYLNVSCQQTQIRAAITNGLGKTISKAKIKAGVLSR